MKQITEIYSYLECEDKYYISMYFFSTLQQIFHKQNNLDKYPNYFILLGSWVIKYITKNFMFVFNHNPWKKMHT